MKSPGQSVRRRQNVIKLGERIHRLLLAFVERERQRAIGSLLKVVFEPFREVKLVCDQRAVERNARRSFAHALKVAAANSKLRQGIVKLEIPFIAAPSRLDRNNACGEAPELRQVWRLENLYGLDAVDRYGHTELSGGGIGDVGRVHHKRAAVLACSGDFDLSFGSAHHTGHQRQGIFHSGGFRRNTFDVVALKVSCSGSYLLYSFL